jgi:hypothetical protein
MQIEQSADLPQYEKAEVKSLPAKKFICVEYPGNVKNVDKAVDTLGGIGSIQRVSTPDLLRNPGSVLKRAPNTPNNFSSNIYDFYK